VRWWCDPRHHLAELTDQLAIFGEGTLQRRLVHERHVNQLGFIGVERVERMQRQHSRDSAVAIASPWRERLAQLCHRVCDLSPDLGHLDASRSGELAAGVSIEQHRLEEPPLRPIERCERGSG
jgi:hypothetical protein